MRSEGKQDTGIEPVNIDFSLLPVNKRDVIKKRLFTGFSLCKDYT